MSRYAALLLLFIGTVQAAPPRLTASVIVDQDLGPGGEVLSRAAIEEAAQILMRETGIELRIKSVDTNHVSSWMFPSPLLAAVQRVRAKNQALRDTGVTLFFTARILRDDYQGYLGIADTGPVCGKDSAAVIRLMQFNDSVVIAHEIAHIFGAPHDGVGKCKAESKTMWMMSGEGVRSQFFSDCSKRIIASSVASTQCLRVK